MRGIIVALTLFIALTTTGYALERPWEKEAGKESRRSVAGNSTGQGSASSAISLDNAIVMGNRNAPLKVIVFTDPDCSLCARLHHAIKFVLQKRNDIVFFLKLYPQAFHKEAYGKSRSIICGDSFKLLDSSFNKEPIPEIDCNSREIDDNIKLAEALGIRVVPTMIFANGHKVAGVKSSAVIIDLVEENKAKR